MPTEHTPQGGPKPHLLAGLIWWLGLVPLYLLLAGRLKAEEVGAGVIAATLTTVALVAVRAQGIQAFRPRLSWVKHLLKLPGMILADSWVVTLALWKRLVRGEHIRGQFSTIPFDPGGDDAESAARRALVTAGITLGPNTFVVQVHRDKQLIAIHQLLPSQEKPDKGDREWPL